MKNTGLLFVLSMALAACNTIAGLGEDMQQVGANLQRGADESQQKIAPRYSSQAAYRSPEVMAYPPSTWGLYSED
jgi:predicted small secreted protein